MEFVTLNYIVSTFVATFVIIDPFAVIPVFITLTERFDEHGILQIRRKSCMIATVILMLFAVAGMAVFQVFGITMPAFQLAGGLLLLQLGLAQLSAERKRMKDEETDESAHRDDISIFPIATPLLAGPGAISTVVLYSSEAKSRFQLGALILVIVAVMFITYLIMKSAPFLMKILGRTGLNLVTRLMGIIIVAVAFQFVINGVKGALMQMGLLPG